MQVLKNINLEIKNKEFVSFIGPSGCDKSTLLNILARLIETGHGEIILKNKRRNKEKYLLQLIKYIHKNSVKGGLKYK